MNLPYVLLNKNKRWNSRSLGNENTNFVWKKNFFIKSKSRDFKNRSNSFNFSSIVSKKSSFWKLLNSRKRLAEECWGGNSRNTKDRRSAWDYREKLVKRHLVSTWRGKLRSWVPKEDRLGTRWLRWQQQPKSTESRWNWSKRLHFCLSDSHGYFIAC